MSTKVEKSDPWTHVELARKARPLKVFGILEREGIVKKRWSCRNDVAKAIRMLRSEHRYGAIRRILAYTKNTASHVVGCLEEPKSRS
jgi:hypothetical protein